VFPQLLWKLLTGRTAKKNQWRRIRHSIVSETYSMHTNRYKLNFKQSLSRRNLQRRRRWPRDGRPTIVLQVRRVHRRAERAVSIHDVCIIIPYNWRLISNNDNNITNIFTNVLSRDGSRIFFFCLLWRYVSEQYQCTVYAWKHNYSKNIQISISIQICPRSPAVSVSRDTHGFRTARVKLTLPDPRLECTTWQRVSIRVYKCCYC
jgi:hypothetical protein